MSNKVVELFGYSTQAKAPDIGWLEVLANQVCPYTKEYKKCYKTRKSSPEVRIGTCVVLYGSSNPEEIIICPNRFMENYQLFVDSIGLLSLHVPGNQLHIIPEVGIPGGSVDFILASVKNGIVKDFVGIELQAIDTTGTIWPERQRMLKKLDLPRVDMEENSTKPFGMNWKMTAKTILVQMHHKVSTFEHVNKKIVLVIQDVLLRYMKREFQFGHLNNANMSDSAYIYSYKLQKSQNDTLNISFDEGFSTDSDGIARCLGLQVEAKVELDHILAIIQSKISERTLFNPFCSL